MGILYSVIGMLSTKIYKKMLRYIAGKGMDFASSNGEALENKVPMMTCHKKRDPATGKLSGFGIDNPEVLNEYPECNAFFVIDDLCDGGGTFCGIADQLKELRPLKSL